MNKSELRKMMSAKRNSLTDEEKAYKSSNIFKNLFHRNPKEYLKKCINSVIVTIICCVFCNFICGYIPGDNVISFILKGILLTIVTNAIFILVYHRTKEFESIKSKAVRVIRRKKGN